MNKTLIKAMANQIFKQADKTIAEMEARDNLTPEEAERLNMAKQARAKAQEAVDAL